jgi:TRAP-type mannitol/chloroaromatic compound transport system substrate-binding protein
MDRRSLITRSGLAGILAAGVSPAVLGQTRVRWRLASSFSQSLDTLYGAAQVFAQKVRQLSGGRFDVRVHPAGESATAFDVVDAVQAGTLDAAHTAPHFFFGKDETFAIGGAIPFGLNSRQMSAWTYGGNGLALMREFYAHYHLVHFPCGNTGAQMGGWMRQPISRLADLRDLKFRIGGLAGKVIERLGAVPQNTPGGEIYRALEKGTLDAAEWIGPYDDQKLAFHQVAPHYHYPGWWKGGLQLDLYIHHKAFEALSAEDKAIVEAASAHAHVITQAKYDAKNPLALKQLVAAGARLRPFPPDVMAEAFKQSMALCDEIAARNPQWKKVYTDYARFRADQNRWFRFSEATFDRFMQSQKL